jgi:hypothetical protein
VRTFTYKAVQEGGHSFVLKHKLFGDLNLTGVMIAHGHSMMVTAMVVPLEGIGGGGGLPVGDPAGFDITEYPIPAGGFVVLPLSNPIPGVCSFISALSVVMRDMFNQFTCGSIRNCEGWLKQLKRVLWEEGFVLPLIYEKNDRKST